MMMGFSNIRTLPVVSRSSQNNVDRRGQKENCSYREDRSEASCVVQFAEAVLSRSIGLVEIPVSLIKRCISLSEI